VHLHTVLLILGVGASCSALAADVKELRWNELAPLIAGNRAEVTLVDGSRVKGEALAVREDTLVMDIRRSSGPTRFAKGNGLVPRPKVDVIKVERRSGTVGRVLGTVGGVLAGMTLAFYAVFAMDSGGGGAIATYIGIVVGFTAAGYYLGQAIDRRTTTIKVVP
jgi:hypothetical protein